MPEQKRTKVFKTTNLNLTVGQKYMVKLCQTAVVMIGVLVLVAQSCPTLCNPMNCSPPGSFVYGIFQARILEWFAVSFSRGSSPRRDQTQVSCTAGFFID